MEVSWNRGTQIINFNCMLHYKTSIWGYSTPIYGNPHISSLKFPCLSTRAAWEKKPRRFSQRKWCIKPASYAIHGKIWEYFMGLWWYKVFRLGIQWDSLNLLFLGMRIFYIWGKKHGYIISDTPWMCLKVRYIWYIPSGEGFLKPWHSLFLSPQNSC